ncbi:glycosyltransferase family 87 protein [Psychromicrobium sp. YIM B11713]|uniref:glycosyltransferase family 87 protein n=1 Tax=Psychromicrobium sp. YIM B11713 TaxID=3145233 RepID=UPI00374ECAA9
MEQSRARRRIVVPSRDDRFLKDNTEIIGGPLGRRTSPGLIRNGFFGVESVLVIMVLIAAVIALIFKDHCRQLGWITPDQFSTTCYSQIPNVFKEQNLTELFPYFSPGSVFDYPPLAGLIAGVTAWLSGFAGSGSARVLGFFDLSAVFLVIAWIIGTLALARSNRRRPWDAAIFAAAPLLLFTAFSSWDLWAASLSAIACFLLSRRRLLLSGLVIGLACCVQPYPALILLALVLVTLRRSAALTSLPVLLGAVLSWLVINLPPIMLNPVSWASYWSNGWQNDASTGSVYQAINAIAQRLGGSGFSGVEASWAALVLLLLGIAAVIFLCFRSQRPPRLAALAFLLVAWFLLVDKHAAPEHLVWLLPLLALARPNWRAVLNWQVFGVLWYLAQLLYLGVILGDNNSQHGIDLPYFVLALVTSGIATLLLIILVVRDIAYPQYDAVRRSGSDDPLLGWLPDLRGAGEGSTGSALGQTVPTTPVHGLP